MGHSSPIRVQGICPSDPTRFPLVIFYVGDDFLVQKLLSWLFMCLTIIMFLTLFFPLCFPFKLWWFLCCGPFSYSCISCLFSHHFYGLFYCLIFRDTSLKSQELSVSFSSYFNGFILFNLFRWIISCSHLFISLIHAFIFPSCFIYYSVDCYFV